MQRHIASWRGSTQDRGLDLQMRGKERKVQLRKEVRVIFTDERKRE